MATPSQDADRFQCQYYIFSISWYQAHESQPPHVELSDNESIMMLKHQLNDVLI